MKSINEIFKKALTCENEEELGQKCIEVAQELSGAKFGFFGEVNKENKFDTLAISNPSWDECLMPKSTVTRLIKGMEIRGMQFLPLKDGKSRIFNDPSNHPDSIGTPKGHPSITCLLVVPFKYRGEIIGQIGLGNKNLGFNNNDLEAIEILSIAMIEALLRKRAEDALKESEKYLKDAQSIAHIGHWKLDSITQEVSGSDELFNIFGLTHNEATLEAFANVVHPEDREYDLLHIKRGIEYGESWDIEHRLTSKKSTEKWVHAKGEAIRDASGKIIMLIGTTQDITERKITEQKLKTSENEYRKAFKQANFYKDLFTHDINNILNNINSSQQLCLLNINNPEKLSDFLDIVKLQVIRGTQLVSNIRNLSQLEERKISLENTEVLEVLNKAIKFVYKSFYTRKINIQVDSVEEELLIHANELLLDVFENLIINAVNHNINQNVEISIKISKVQEQTKNFFKFEFIDNGIGIIDKRKKIIFQKRYNEDKSVKGLGFGLTLVKKIIETYYGKIWVEDKVKGDYSKGSNFIILIPEINS